MKIDLDKKRKQRYKDKIAYSRERLLNLEEWLFKSEQVEEVSMLASEKAFQETIEAITDVFAMLLCDMKLEVSDDYSNIEKIEKRGIINKEQEKICIEANGLRNVVIHKYNNVNEEKFIERVKNLLPHLYKILEHLDNFIDNIKNV